MNHIVIMAGGKGTRLWPMSRTSKPKQLQNLIGKTSMIQDTVKRVAKFTKYQNIYISTNADYKPLIKRQLPKIPDKNYIIEPVGRNTAPAIGLIAAKIIATDEEAIITTIASDHIIAKQANFTKVIKAAQAMVTKQPEMIGTIGIKPTSAHTGYGYIKKDQLLETINGVQIYQVKQFVEKPNLATAKKYLKTGQYFWNASYFTFSAQTILDAFAKHEPTIYKHLAKIKAAVNTKAESKVIKEQFKTIPELAIDYLVEKMPAVFVIPADLGWDDIGSWEALHDIISEETKSSVVDRGNHLGIDNKDCLIYAQDKLIATVGLENIVVVDTDDATLICHKSRTQDVKKIVNELKNQKKNHKYL